ncbi:hypothetical protein TNCV_5130031 [Trichonephila clavipes]|nr:hypothetical protein TNCV_5130031 [Trichonephila clavipes]
MVSCRLRLSRLKVTQCGRLEIRVSTQVSSTSLDQGSKLRGASPIVLLQLQSVALIKKSNQIRCSNVRTSTPLTFNSTHLTCIRTSKYVKSLVSVRPFNFEIRCSDEDDT